MQQVPQIVLPTLTCCKEKLAAFVCINPSCQENGLICLDPNCKQCKENHSSCPIYWVDKLVSTITKKRRNLDSQVQEAFDEMNRIYDQIINKLSKDKQSLLDQIQYYGLNEKEAEFCRLALCNDFDSIKGSNVSILIKDINKEQLFTANAQMIQRYWKNREAQFDQIFKNFKRMWKLKRGSFDSKITDDVPTLNEFFEGNPYIHANLLYRASESNFSVADFHTKCDNKAHTLLIAKSEFGNIFGAYTPIKWSCSSNYINDPKKQSFLFSITKKRKYHLKSSEYALYGNSSYGPAYGGGHDLYICDQSNSSNGSYFNLGHSYNVEQYGITSSSQQAYTQLVGATSGYNARIVEWEIFQLEF